MVDNHVDQVNKSSDNLVHNIFKKTSILSICIGQAGQGSQGSKDLRVFAMHILVDLKEPKEVMNLTDVDRSGG